MNAVGRDSKGRPKITDAAAADAEWKASTYENRIPISGPASRHRAPQPVAGETVAGPVAGVNSGRARVAAAADDDAPPRGESALGEARARLDAAKASLAELDLAERRRELVPAKDVEDRLVSVFTGCKTKLLGVPSRARQQDPTLTASQVTMIEALVREALEDIADGPARGDAA